MGKIRVAVIGCGAISQEWHIPILKGHPDFQLAALVDRDSSTLAQLAAVYDVEQAVDDYQKLSLDGIDAVVVATPVSLHFDISLFFIEHKKHVLVEKPIALDFDQSKQLVDSAKAHNVSLCVGLYRRLYPSFQLLKQLIDSGEYGAPLGFEFNWGDFYSWKATSLGNMQKALAGGGVLMDLGPHALDWLTALFGHNVKVTSYSDDAQGGIDADCSVSLEFTNGEAPVCGVLNLSRVRALGGALKVRFDKVTAQIGVGDRFAVTLKDNDDTKQHIVHTLSDATQSNLPWFESFKAEFDDFLFSITKETPAQLSGESVLPAMQVISDCYAQQQAKTSNILPESQTSFSVAALKGKKVLVTGATGFIGGRICEVLATHGDCEILAAVNNPNNASRLSRLNVDMQPLDITNPQQCLTRVEDCDVVIHCAVGTAYGDDKAVERVTVDGTSNLLAACNEKGVSQFVYLSSLAVVDLSADHIDESTGNTENTEELYARTKLEAEKRVKEAASETLFCSILRPTNVYGPESPLFKVGAGVQLLKAGISMTPETANAPINAVYIDNLVEAVLLCAQSNNAKVNGAHILVNDENSVTYKTFYSFFADKFDVPLNIESSPSSNESHSVRTPGLLSEVKSILGSKELKKLLKKVYDKPKLGFLPRKVIEAFPALEDKFRDTSAVVYTSSDTGAASPIWIEPSTMAMVKSTLLTPELGYSEIVDNNEALARTYEWLLFAYSGSILSKHES